MINSFIKKIEAILKDLPLRTEISISFTNANGTNFIGLKKEESGIKYIDNKTIAFEIGSVTKAFTGNVFAKLATDRRIKLDDLIELFLPFKLLGNPPITFKHLALHTSGLPRMPIGYDDRVDFIKENPFSNYREEDFANYLTKDLVMESSPGEKANYSNLGFGLLSYIISLIENKEFSQ
ncbi:MAG TPA: serine hydrolase domain-containing protein, partial [Bacteroidia bacterium]